jgi:ketosteroid isomerase-like protein
MVVSQPQEIHQAVQDAFNAKDVDGLVALYESDARMVGPDGSVVVGTDAIREQWQFALAMNAPMQLRTRFCIEAGDLALLRNDWRLDSLDVDMASSTTEVVRRQPDGSWRYIIDHPFGASDMIP